MLHNWSKEAVAAFWKAAHMAPGRMDVRRGMDAALVADSPLLAPVFAALWAEALTSESMAPIMFRVQQGDQSVIIHANREFLFRVLNLVPEVLPHATDSAGPEGLPAPDGRGPADNGALRDL